MLETVSNHKDADELIVRIFKIRDELLARNIKPQHIYLGQHEYMILTRSNDWHRFTVPQTMNHPTKFADMTMHFLREESHLNVAG